MKVNIMVGVSGSGKSTYVKNHKEDSDVVICTDEIRKEICGNINNQSKNKKVFEIAYERLIKAAANSKSIWFDATSTTMKAIRQIINYVNLADKNYNVIINIMTDSFDVPLCKLRIAKDIENKTDRSNTPGEIVDRMSNNFRNTLIEIAKHAADFKGITFKFV